MRPFRLAVLCLALTFLPALPARGDDSDVARARELLKAYRIKDRQEGIRLLVAADSAAAVQPLEDAIKTSVKDMDRLAKDLDKLDLRYDQALGYWESARTSDNAEFYDLAKRYLAAVKKDWGMAAARMELLLEIAVDAGAAFAKLKSPGAMRALENGAKTESDPLVRSWYVAGISPRIGRQQAMPTLLKLVTATEPLTRSMALRALRPAAMDRRVFDAAVAASADRAWQARIAAYEIVARAPLDEAAPRLVAAAEKETGEVAVVVDDLLFALTGMSHAQNPRQWGPFWKEHGAEILEGTWTAPEADASDGSTVETFFSIPIDSTNVLFCLDYSSSMEAELAHPDPRNAELRAKWKLPATRLGVAQAETIRAIRGLPATALMNLVVFSDKAKRYASRPVAASESSKSSAISWLLAQKTGWLTNIYDGLRVSFDDVLAPGGSAQRFVDLPDTIVFLTDGTPTRGRFQDDETILTLVSLWNGPVGAAIHAVGIGNEHAEELLKSLASATRGSYHDVAGGKPTKRIPRSIVPVEERQPPLERTLAEARNVLESEAPATERAAALLKASLLADWSTAAMDLCTDRLGDAEAEVRAAAVSGLAVLAPDFVPAVVTRLGPHLLRGLEASDEGCGASLRLVEAVGAPAAGAAESLARLVASTTSPHRVAAARALGAIGPPAARAAVPTLVATRALPTCDPELKAAIDAALNRIRR